MSNPIYNTSELLPRSFRQNNQIPYVGNNFNDKNNSDKPEQRKLLPLQRDINDLRPGVVDNTRVAAVRPQLRPDGTLMQTSTSFGDKIGNFTDYIGRGLQKADRYISHIESGSRIDANSPSEAYNIARNRGLKTYSYNGKMYNTDYSSPIHEEYEQDLKDGLVREWNKQYPNYTYPTLVKAKQLELNTYGITNEQTQDRNIFKRNFMESERIVNATPIDGAIQLVWPMSNKYARDNFSKTIELKNYLVGKPMSKTRQLGISSYRPNGASDQYYYNFNRNPLGAAPEALTQDYRTWYPAHSDFKSYVDNDNDNRYVELPRVQRLYDKLPDIPDINTYGNFLRVTGYGNEDYDLGTYTYGNTPDFNSYYDKWDIAGGPVEDIIGNPMKIYDRRYKTSTPDIQKLFKEFKENDPVKLLKFNQK